MKWWSFLNFIMKVLATQLATQWHVIKKRTVLLTSQISHLLRLPLHVARAVLLARQESKHGIMPERRNRAAWTSTDSYCNPFKPIPNCRAFKIRLGTLDPLFLLLGLKKKLASDITIQPYANRHMVKYAEYQIQRLNKLRDSGNATAFWQVASDLMIHSNTFHIMALNHVFPQWQRRQSLASVFSWLKKARKIQVDLKNSYGWTARINFARKYILKANGSWRPLGVPTPPWRLVLHLWAQFFSIWTHTWMPKTQHGFVSGRGTLTAWKDLLSRMDKAQHIYEFDLKDCFNKIRLDTLSDILGRTLLVPAWIVNRFAQLNMSVPRFGRVTKLDESQYLERSLLQKDPRRRFGVGSTPKDSRSFPEQQQLSDMIQSRYRAPSVDPILDVNWGPPIMTKTIKSSSASNEMWEAFYSSGREQDKYEPLLKPRPKGSWNPPHHLNQSYGSFVHPEEELTVWDRENWVGLPQGAATSPIMTNIALKPGLYDRHATIVGYADDGLKLSDVIDGTPIDLPSHGIFEKEGSGWCKLNGQWLKPVKFLGLEYNPFTGMLKANTRKGSELELNLKSESGVDLETIMREFDLRYGLYHPPSKESWEVMINSKLAGWAQARLYGGSWNLDSFWQDFTYTFVSSSWSKKVGGKCDRNTEVGIFNSSSVASGWLASQLLGGSSKQKARDLFGRSQRRAGIGVVKISRRWLPSDTVK